MMRDKVEKMIETMDKVVEKTLHLVTPDSLKYMDCLLYTSSFH